MSLNSRRLFLSSAIAGLLFFSACTKPYQRVASKPVAKVNDHILTTKDFSNELARRLKNFDAVAAKDPNIINQSKEEILNSFIIKSLSVDWALSAAIIISDADLDAEASKLRAHFPDDLSFRRSLVMENLSFSAWKEELRYILIQKAISKKLIEKAKPIENDEITKYYNNNKNLFKRKEQVFLRQILVDELAKAEAIKKSLTPSSFADYAKKYSIAPEAKIGGLVGWIEKGSVDFFDSLFSAPINSIQTVQSPYGVHLVLVEKKIGPSFQDLELAKTQIRATLLAQREQAEYKNWLDRMLRSSSIFKDYELVHALRVETRGEK